VAGEREVDQVPDGDEQKSQLKGKEPEIVPPGVPPPKQLVRRDLKVGTGTEAKTGDRISVQYVGVRYDNGEEISSTWDFRNAPFRFRLGVGQVVAGWDRGIEGMKVGGRRELIVPPDIGYPESGTLIFVIDLLAVRRPQGARKRSDS
jgi:peptidylprolyl isomerase